MTVRWPLLVRRVHKWLALFVGLQAVIWTASGMYMVAVHIDIIHGDHLVRQSPFRSQDISGFVPPAAIVGRLPGIRDVSLADRLGQPAWRADTAAGATLFDARTGLLLEPLTKTEIEEAARRIYTGRPAIVATRLLTAAPQEMQSRKPPFWQVEFEGWNRPTLYLSPTTGELIGRRHNLWRIFDFVWMLHIMDYAERSNVNNPLLRIATWSAVTMALAGALLLLWSFPKKKKRTA